MQVNTIQKRNFIQRFFASFISPEFYIQAVQEPLGKAIRYALLFSFLLSVIGSLYFSLEVKQTFTYLDAFISDSHFPDLIITNGKLKLDVTNDTEISIGDNKNFIAILDSGDTRNYTHLNGYQYGIFVNQDYIAFKRANAESFVVKFSQLSNLRLPKEAFQRAMGIAETVSYVFTFFFYFLRVVFQYAFKGLIVYALLSFTFPIIKVRELSLRSSQVFSVILYAMSFATLASELFQFMTISNQWILSILVIFYYMATLRIARTGILAILLDRLGGKLPADSDDEWFRM